MPSFSLCMFPPFSCWLPPLVSHSSESISNLSADVMAACQIYDSSLFLKYFFVSLIFPPYAERVFFYHPYVRFLPSSYRSFIFSTDLYKGMRFRLQKVYYIIVRFPFLLRVSFPHPHTDQFSLFRFGNPPPKKP